MCGQNRSYEGLALGWCPRPQGVAPGWLVSAPFGAQKTRTEDIPGFCQIILPHPTIICTGSIRGIDLRLLIRWRRIYVKPEPQGVN